MSPAQSSRRSVDRRVGRGLLRLTLVLASEVHLCVNVAELVGNLMTVSCLGVFVRCNYSVFSFFANSVAVWT